MERQTLKTIKARLAEHESVQGATTVRTYTGDLVTGVVTWVGGYKVRIDTPLAAIFIRYDEIEEVA